MSDKKHFTLEMFNGKKFVDDGDKITIHLDKNPFLASVSTTINGKHYFLKSNEVETFATEVLKAIGSKNLKP